MSINKRDLVSCLKGKFGFDEVEETRHDAVSLFVGNQKVATTRFSRSLRGQENISPTLLSLIAKQLWVDLATLKKMYGCTESREQYLQRLREQRIL